MLENMDDGAFEPWDAAFLEEAIQVEEATTQGKPPPHPPPLQRHQQPPIRFGYAHQASDTSYSPPRELSQRPVTTNDSDYDRHSSNVVAAVPPVARSFRSSRGGSGTSSEIIRLKKELESVSKKLTKKEQECLELRKEREKKEVQLQSANLPKEARSRKGHRLRSTNLDLTVPPQDCAGVSACYLEPNASNDQGSLHIERGLYSNRTKGVQTEEEFDVLPLPTDRETSSCIFLSKKLKEIRRSSADLCSGRYLVSKLFVVCATDLQVLFGYCNCTTSSKPKEVNDENLSHVTSMVNAKLLWSSDAAKVSRFYNAITKMSNGMVQFETFYHYLLELCKTQNPLIVHRSLRILHVVLLNFAGYQGTSTRDFCASEATNDVSAFYGTDSIKNICQRHYNTESRHTSVTSPSCIEWLSLFQLIHQISNSVFDEPVLYEAISIMNVILKREGLSKRERYGQITVFQTVPKFLKKEFGLRVQKEAVHLIYLLVNCPTVIASLYSGFKENMPNSKSENDILAFEGLSSILAGLEDCLKCTGTVIEALELRRNAIILVSYLVSFGASCFEVLWSSTVCNKTGFLVLILRLLSSEMDSETCNPSELTDIMKQRTLLVREALIFLNRIVSHPTFSGAALQALTSSREVASLTIDTASRLSCKRKSIWQDDGMTKQMLENEIPEFARMLYRKVAAYLGENVLL